MLEIRKQLEVVEQQLETENNVLYVPGGATRFQHDRITALYGEQERLLNILRG